MAALKFLNLFAISSLAILACSLNASPVNALVTDQHHVGRSVNHGHNGIAKRKRDGSSKRCKPRPASSAALVSVSVHVGSPASSTHDAKPTTPAPSATSNPAPPKPTGTKAAAPPPPPPPAPPATGGGGGGGKIGLAWSNGEQDSLANFVNGNVRYVYNWSPGKPSGADALGLKFLAQLWGEKQISDFQRLVKPGYAQYVLGFNEPDIGSQSNLDPGYAAQLWKQYIDPLKNNGYTLISPATTNAPSGKTWLQNFHKSCTGCTIQGTATHFYGTNAQDLISHLQDMHTTFGLPVWLTEFSCQDYSGKNQQCNQDQIYSFLGTAAGFMQSQDWIAAYFWFAPMTSAEMEANNVNGQNALIGSGNKPNGLGNVYLNP